MALTRKLLKGMGLTEEQVDTIIEAHTDSLEAVKEERDTLKDKADKFDSVSKELEKLKESAKNEDGETVSKTEYDKIKKEYEDYKADITAKETKTAKEHAFREILTAAGIPEKRQTAIIKASGAEIDALEFDKDGKVKNSDKISENVKTEWADFVVTTTVQGAETVTPPQSNSGGDVDLGTLSMKDYIAARQKND